MDSTQPPFPRSTQLNHDLDYLLPPQQPYSNNEKSSPQHVQSQPSPLPTAILPGNPRIKLSNTTKLTNFLTSEFFSAELDLLAPHLWVMSTQSSANIEPLHKQNVKGREIIITEQPKLHLVWYYDRVFIKPLPAYLLSYAFWSVFLLSPDSPLGAQREEIRRAALGYLRTYAYLIRHESDFFIAQREELRLVPEGVTWEQFCAFAEHLEEVSDENVSQRYSYGELRLSRLNFYIKIFLRKWRFMRVHSQYGEYFARFYGPLLFAFGVLSIMLNAMQVEMVVEQLGSSQWQAFRDASRGFSVYCLILVVLISILLIALFVYRVADEWIYALRDRRRKKQEKFKLSGA
jgi:hypothetical protein